MLQPKKIKIFNKYFLYVVASYIFTTYIDILFHYFNTSNAWYIFSVLHKLRSDPKLFFFWRHTVKKALSLDTPTTPKYF